MKLRNPIHLFSDEGEVLAQFGQAALIRKTDGKWQLRGGSRADRLTAREWISLFKHDVVVPKN